MKRILVTGSNGLIGRHLVRRLVADGYWVRAIHRGEPEGVAQHSVCVDLAARPSVAQCYMDGIDEVYDLAAQAGGLGYIDGGQNDARIAYNNTLCNLHTLDAANKAGARYLFTSSAVVYPQQRTGLIAHREDDAIPADPAEGAYGWQKLYHEQVIAAYRDSAQADVRIARLQNTYGVGCHWHGGREKAPAALCRKVARYALGLADCIEVWGDGTQARSFTHVDDVVDGLIRLMETEYRFPLNIGSNEMVTVDQLLGIICDAARLDVYNPPHIIHRLDKPTGVPMRGCDNRRCLDVLEWEPTTSIHDGMAELYPWIAGQVAAQAKGAA